eukprot:3450778-Rhodomonas_salina.1
MGHVPIARWVTALSPYAPASTVPRADVQRANGLQVHVHSAVELPKMDQFSGRCDPYVVVSINETGKQGKVSPLHPTRSLSWYKRRTRFLRPATRSLRINYYQLRGPYVYLHTRSHSLGFLHSPLVIDFGTSHMP